MSNKILPDQGSKGTCFPARDRHPQVDRRPSLVGQDKRCAEIRQLAVISVGSLNSHVVYQSWHQRLTSCHFSFLSATQISVHCFSN